MGSIAPSHESHALASDAKWQLVRRVAGSRTFSRAHKLSAFLLFVCEKELLGQSAQITEQQVGIQVFGRRPGYSTNEDNIVRSQARILRQKIDLFFATEGAEDETIIVIPRGGYTPSFVPRPSQPLVRIR